MSVTGYWDEAFEAAFSEKSPALTRTLQWILGDKAELDCDYEVVYRKQQATAGSQREVDFLAENAIVTSIGSKSGKLHIEIQACSFSGMMQRMLSYAANLATVTRGQRHLQFPYQTVVMLEAESDLTASRKIMRSELTDAFGNKFGTYTVPLIKLDPTCEGTLFDPVCFSETNDLNETLDMAEWSRRVDIASATLNPKLASRYAEALLRASQRRYHLRKEFATMTNEERLAKYKDFPSPLKIARKEGRREGVEQGALELAKRLRKEGVSEEAIRSALASMGYSYEQGAGGTDNRVPGLDLDK